MSEAINQSSIINPTPGFKILNLKANNFLRLKAVDITPGETPIIHITGQNGAGKSSVLKAIWSAFANRELSKEIKNPIRTGEDTGSVSVDLGDLIITRTWTSTDTYLSVESKDGLIYKSPQAILDKLKTSLTFDPLAFTRMQPKDQRTTLMKLLGVDTDSLDKDRETRFNTRTEINRKLNEATGQLAAYHLIPVGSYEPISATELIKEIRKGQESNEKRQKVIRNIDHYQDIITRLEKELRDAKVNLESNEIELSKTPVIDLGPLEEKLANIEEENKLVERRIKQREVMERVRELAIKSEDLTEEIAQIDDHKKKLLQSASFPVEGLSFDTEGILYQGIPLSQASSAEKIRVSCAMGMAMKPGLRVMLIEDGSLLDATSRKIIEDLAREYDMQVWIETVDETGKYGIIIEDGEVKT